MKKKATPSTASALKNYDGLIIGIRELLEKLALDLTQNYERGFSRFRALCLAFPDLPQIRATLSLESPRRDKKLQTPSAKSQIVSPPSIKLARSNCSTLSSKSPIQILPTVSEESSQGTIASTPSRQSIALQIGPTLSGYYTLPTKVMAREYRLALPDEKKLLQTIQEARQQVERAAKAREVLK